MNGHIIRFRAQTQKLESPYKTPSSTRAVKGLNFGDFVHPKLPETVSMPKCGLE